MVRQLPGAVTVRLELILPLAVLCGSIGAASRINQTELIASALAKRFIWDENNKRSRKEKRLIGSLKVLELSVCFARRVAAN